MAIPREKNSAKNKSANFRNASFVREQPGDALFMDLQETKS